MDRSKTCNILSMVTTGVNPIMGERFPAVSLYSAEDDLRAPGVTESRPR